MPHLIFPVDKDGLLIDVLIGLDGATTTALFSAGQPIPPPIRARAAIDTGSDVTVVSRSILQQLGVPVQHQTTTQTVSGLVTVNLYKVSVGITDFGSSGAAEFVEPTVLVMGLPQTVPVIEVLIGLDMLLGCRFLLDGPGRHFMLDF
jgi:hypothetical protein